MSPGTQTARCPKCGRRTRRGRRRHSETAPSETGRAPAPRKARFLVEQLAAKGIHHAHRAGLDGADHRVVSAAPFHELADQYALVDQVDRLTVRHETPPSPRVELRVPRVDDAHL